MQVNKLRARMALVGINQADLANQCGFTENTLCNKIAGKTEFKANEIVRICEVLGIDDPTEQADIFLTSPSQ